jgi:hypothetical protein
MSKPKKFPQLALLDENRRYPLPLAAAYLGISRAWLFVKIRRGEIKILKDASRTFVPGSEIVRHSRFETAA